MRENFRQRPPEFFLDPQVPLAQGLVFAGLGRFTGSTLYKNSATDGRDGTLTNMIPSTATSGWSINTTLGRPELLWENAATRVVQLPIIAYAAQGTMSAWVRWTNFLSNAQVFDQRNAGAYVFQFGNYYEDNMTWGWYTNGTDYRMSATPATYGIVANALNHFSMTWDDAANTTRVYKNGVVLVEKTDALVTYTPNVRGILGDYNLTGASAFQGSISDFMYHERVLSSSEISALADPSNVMLGIGGNPLLRYRRKWWPVGAAGAPAGTTIRWPWQQRYRRRMTGA